MSTKVPTDARSGTVKELRRARRRRTILRLLVGVGAPTLIGALYLGLFTTPQFESESSFTVHSSDGGASTSALQMLISSVPGSAGQDVNLVLEYIQSRDVLQKLVDEHGFREHYTSGNIDILSRLPRDASFEEVYDYYLNHVSVEHESTSGSLTLRVRAFDATAAHRFSEAILSASEAMVNELNVNARRDRIELARAEVERAEARLASARRAITEFQREHGTLNPMASAEEVGAVRARLETELAVARAELRTLGATLQPTAPEVIRQRSRVSALEAQVRAQNARLVGSETDGIGEELAEFEPLYIEKEFAQRAYESALASAEVARIDATRQHRYVVRVSGPSEPDRPAYPRFWYSLLTIFLLSFAFLGIGTLVVASIREHANL